MLKFSYLAKSQSGSTIQGFITAPNEDIAITDLQSKGLIIISLKSTNQQSVFKQDLEIFNRVSDRELVVFSRILATFLEVQIPLVEALSLKNLPNETQQVLLNEGVKARKVLRVLVKSTQDKHLKIISN